MGRSCLQEARVFRDSVQDKLHGERGEQDSQDSRGDMHAPRAEPFEETIVGNFQHDTGDQKHHGHRARARDPTPRRSR